MVCKVFRHLQNPQSSYQLIPNFPPHTAVRRVCPARRVLAADPRIGHRGPGPREGDLPLQIGPGGACFNGLARKPLLIPYMRNAYRQSAVGKAARAAADKYNGP